MVAGILTALLVLPAAPDKKIAMVLVVKGTATVQIADSHPRPARVMDLLAEGDRVSVSDGEAVLIFIEDNHRERIKAKARVTVTAGGCTPPEAVERLKAIGKRVAYRDVPRLSAVSPSGGVVLRDPGIPFPAPAVTPLFGTTVLSDRPAFSWQPIPGARAYRVRLVCVRPDAREGETVWSADTKEARLPYPEKEKSLSPGKTYTWYVSAPPGGPDEEVLCKSRLTVATAAEVAELAKLGPLAAGEEPADLLLAGLIYLGYGACDEALAAFERLARLRPEEGRFQAALGYFYARAGRMEESGRALERAEKLLREANPR